MRWAAVGAAAAIFAGGPASAQDGRGPEMTTDRPSVTESPYIAQRGRPQLESTLFGFSREPDRSNSYEVATTNLRLGLTQRLEADIILQPYGRYDAPGAATQQGIGDLTLRLKFNLARPEGAKQRGEVAAAVLPFVNMPTDRGDGISDDVWGGGLLVPLDVSLGGRFNLGLNTGFVVLREERSRGYEVHPLLTAALSCDWTERWGTFYEVAAELNRGDPAGDIVAFDTGVTYRVGPNVQLDAGVNVGATRAASRVETFVGLSARF